MGPIWGGKGAAYSAALAVMVALAACSSSSEGSLETTPRSSWVATPFVGHVDLESRSLAITPVAPAIGTGSSALTYVGGLESIPVVQDGTPGNATEAVDMATVGALRIRTGGCMLEPGVVSTTIDSVEADVDIYNGFAAVDLRNVYVEVYDLPTGYNSCISAPPGWPAPAGGWITPALGLYQYSDIGHGGTGRGMWSFRLPSGANFTFRGVVWAEKVERTAPVTTAAPAAGSYTGPQQLTLSCTDAGGCADTFYTIDGGAAIPYTAPIRLSGSQNICYWSVDLRSNTETQHCATWTVTMAGATATYDAGLGAPKCGSLASGCDSGTTVGGRPTELNDPNTIDTCTDGGLRGTGTNESLEQLVIQTVEGGPLEPGVAVTIAAVVYAAADLDFLDVFTATTTVSPTWTYLTSVQVPASARGLVTLTTPSLTLPSGVVAIRGRFGFDTLNGSGYACGAGVTDDNDDLVFVTDVLPKGTSAPTGVAVTAPAASSTLGRQVLITASASDDVAVTSVAFQWQNYNGGTALGWQALGTDTAPPWAFAWNTEGSSFADSTVDLRVIATDSDGNTTTSDPVRISVLDRTAPTVTWSSPTANANVSGATVTLSATATDNINILNVEFYVDGYLVCSDNTASGTTYSCAWPTTGYATGMAHVVFARAYDYASIRGQTPPIYLNLQ